MPDPSLLAPSAVTIPGPELRDAVVLDDATARGQEVRCTVESLDPLLATDPMPFKPYMTAEGEFWPKKGDRAVISAQTDGLPVILIWWPGAEAMPDVALP
jgi:hypothetical protein